SGAVGLESEGSGIEATGGAVTGMLLSTTVKAQLFIHDLPEPASINPKRMRVAFDGTSSTIEHGAQPLSPLIGRSSMLSKARTLLPPSTRSHSAVQSVTPLVFTKAESFTR